MHRLAVTVPESNVLYIRVVCARCAYRISQKPTWEFALAGVKYDAPIRLAEAGEGTRACDLC